MPVNHDYVHYLACSVLKFAPVVRPIDRDNSEIVWVNKRAFIFGNLDKMPFIPSNATYIIQCQHPRAAAKGNDMWWSYVPKGVK